MKVLVAIVLISLVMGCATNRNKGVDTIVDGSKSIIEYLLIEDYLESLF